MDEYVVGQVPDLSEVALSDLSLPDAALDAAAARIVDLVLTDPDDGCC